MNNLIEVAQNYLEIVKGPPIDCPSCNERWFSPCDKLYVSAYGKCIMCSSHEEIEALSPNIFTIIEEGL